MLILWGTLAGLALWLELVYHFSGFGWTAFNPIYAAALIIAWAGIWTLPVGLLKGKFKKIIKHENISFHFFIISFFHYL